VLSRAWPARWTATLPRDARDTLFLLAVIGWILLPQAARLPLWCSLLTAGVLLWRASLALHGHALPSRWWLLALLAAAIGLTVMSHGTVLGRDAGVTLLVVLLALKTLELRARRDAFVVFFLGFFTMLTNFFVSQSLLTALAMLLGLLGLLTALVNAHMPVGRPPLSASARLAGRMALAGAPVMLVLFLVFPRLAPLWGIPSDAMSGRSGLSATMEVGNLAALALDDSIAMRVRFDAAPPPQQQLYFRGPVLSLFDGRQWRPARGEPSLGARPATDVQLLGPAIGYEVTLEPHNRPWLLLLDLATEAPQLPGSRAWPTPDMQWLAQRPVTDLLRYRAHSHLDYRYGPRQRNAELQAALQLPPGSNPRTVALAAALQRDAPGGAGDPQALVSAALQRLRSGGYQYTLEPGVYGEHSADEFWFDRKQGFCEHIASAFVVLARAMDIPARIVTGYQGGEMNAVDGYWTVRQSDAHAWAEVWIAGQGWLRVDPTAAVAPGRVGSVERLRGPPGVLANAVGTLSPNAAAQLRAVWDAVNNRWNQWVLNYTQARQLDLLRALGFDAPDWQTLGQLLVGLLVLACLGAGAWSLWERRQHDPWLRLLQQAHAQLVRAGLQPAPQATPRQLAGLLVQLPALAAQPQQLAQLHQWLLQLEAQRYASGPHPELGGLRRAFHRLPWPEPSRPPSRA
jgi:transglutaminase-like putative cysteine protease